MPDLVVVLETHSTTTDNESGVATGWAPGRLSAAGRRQAAALGMRRRDGFDLVVSSDLARAVETVDIAFAGSAVPRRTDRRLRECDYGDWTGMPVARLDRERIARVDVPFPTGESWRQAAARTGELLDELAASPSSRVLLVGHAAQRYALEHLLAGRDLADVVAAPFAWQQGWTYVVPRP